MFFFFQKSVTVNVTTTKLHGKGEIESKNEWDDHEFNLLLPSFRVQMKPYKKRQKNANVIKWQKNSKKEVQSFISENSVKTNRVYKSQIVHFSTEINPAITNPG